MNYTALMIMLTLALALAFVGITWLCWAAAGKPRRELLKRTLASCLVNQNPQTPREIQQQAEIEKLRIRIICMTTIAQATDQAVINAIHSMAESADVYNNEIEAVEKLAGRCMELKLDRDSMEGHIDSLNGVIAKQGGIMQRNRNRIIKLQDRYIALDTRYRALRDKRGAR